MKYLVIIALAVTGLLVGAARYTRVDASQASQFSDESLFTVRRGELVVSVTENGFLKAKNSVQVQPRANGTLEWLIEEGELVKKDDILAELEKDEDLNAISEKENGLIQYEAELEAAQATLEIQRRDNEASIEKAGLQVELKRLELEKYELGEYPSELRKLRLSAEKAESAFHRSERNFKEVPELVEAGFMTKSQEEEERINLREAEIGLETAKKDLELYETYTHRMTLTQKQSDLRDAERELENSQAKAQISLKEKEARLNQSERQVQSTKVRLEELREDLANMTIRAPGPGIVHYGDPDQPWYKDQVKLGNRLRQGNTIFTLPDLTEMQVMLEVHEADIDMVKEGLAVVVTVETHKGKSFVGEVTDVASVATTDGWGGESSKRFTVEITLAALDVELRAGVTAKAEIHIDTIENALQVPIHAIVAEGDKHFCFVVGDDGQANQRTVKIGKNNPHYVQVLEGLKEGERVLLRDPRGSGSSAGTRTDETEGGEESSGFAESMGGGVAEA